MKKLLLPLLIFVLIGVIFVIVAFHNNENEKISMEVPKVSTAGAETVQTPQEKMISVPTLCQYPELPTGCEGTAAAMVLQFYGASVTPEEFAADWLARDEVFYWSGDEMHGPDPDEVFAGNPFSEYAYGCYATPIVNAINDNSISLSAIRITDRDLPSLCETYISQGRPLLIWATMGMKEPKAGRSWTLPNGSDFTWIAGEHCLVLVGFDADYYYLNDPQTGGTVAYEKELVEKRFEALGSQTVYISPK